MSCLLINDIDAGLGHFANTQVRNSSSMPTADMPLGLCNGSLSVCFQVINLAASKSKMHLEAA